MKTILLSLLASIGITSMLLTFALNSHAATLPINPKRVACWVPTKPKAIAFTPPIKPRTIAFFAPDRPKLAFGAPRPRHDLAFLDRRHPPAVA